MSAAPALPLCHYLDVTSVTRGLRDGLPGRSVGSAPSSSRLRHLKTTQSPLLTAGPLSARAAAPSLARLHSSRPLRLLQAVISRGCFFFFFPPLSSLPPLAFLPKSREFARKFPILRECRLQYRSSPDGGGAGRELSQRLRSRDMYS